MHNSIQTENVQLAHVWQNFRYKMLFCLSKFCLISSYSNSVLFLRISLFYIYPVFATIIKKQSKFQSFTEVKSIDEKYCESQSLNKFFFVKITF